MIAKGFGLGPQILHKTNQECLPVRNQHLRPFHFWLSCLERICQRKEKAGDSETEQKMERQTGCIIFLIFVGEIGQSSSPSPTEMRK